MAALVAPLALALVLGCASSCPTGRVKSESGTCVQPEVVDFVACVRGAGGATIDQESAHRIGASAYGAQGAFEWQDRVRADFSGPGGEAQRMVIDACIARTRPPAPALDPARFFGSWIAVTPDRTTKELTITPDQRFVAADVTGSSRCDYGGVLRVDGGTITRTILGASAACGWVPVGLAQQFPVVHSSPGQFTIRTESGDVTYVAARRN